MMPYAPEQIKYLSLLAKQYPTAQSLYTEIINLQAILNLPKGTEHFMSDLHGESQAFEHILNSCSGVIREKVLLHLGGEMTEAQVKRLCTLIYYPTQKLKMHISEGGATPEWYKETLLRLIRLARFLSSKYTRSKVRKALPQEFAYVIDELLHAQEDEDANQHVYHEKIIQTLIEIGSGPEFVISLCQLIKRLAVDRLHVLGDVFDRGPRPDAIMDMLLAHHAVDFAWGNHDILWMGAAAGSLPCVAAAIRNSLAYGNMAVLENGYGIGLRTLSLLAGRLYPALPQEEAAIQTVTVIMFKLEGQLIRRHPEYGMDERLLLNKIDRKSAAIKIGGQTYPLACTSFPTLCDGDPYRLTEEEQALLDEMAAAFTHSERLQRHALFLFNKGGMYRCVNGNLLYHGCIPMDEDGRFQKVFLGGAGYQGRRLMDFCDSMARAAYFSKEQDALDFLWYLWCGDTSPLCGRSVKTFQRLLIGGPEAWHEQRNPYYTWIVKEETCRMVLEEFGLSAREGRIINGHTPVLLPKGETAVRAGGRLIVIDGGFCKAYQSQTGIAGYTLIVNSHGLRLVKHQPMRGGVQLIAENDDILSQQADFIPFAQRRMVADTDDGCVLANRIRDLKALLDLYRRGDGAMLLQ